MAGKIYILFAIDRLTVNRLTVNKLTVVDIPFVMDKVQCHRQHFLEGKSLTSESILKWNIIVGNGDHIIS